MTKDEYADDDESNTAWSHFVKDELYPSRPWKSFPSQWQPIVVRKSDSPFAQVSIWDPDDGPGSIHENDDTRDGDGLSLLAVIILESSSDRADESDDNMEITSKADPPKVVAAAATNLLMLEDEGGLDDTAAALSESKPAGSWRSLMFPIPPNASQNDVVVLAVYEVSNAPESLVVYEQILSV